MCILTCKGHVIISSTLRGGGGSKLYEGGTYYLDRMYPRGYILYNIIWTGGTYYIYNLDRGVPNRGGTFHMGHRRPPDRHGLFTLYNRHRHQTYFHEDFNTIYTLCAESYLFKVLHHDLRRI